MELTKEHARKVLAVVDAGLVEGLGIPEPGKMCVEAAVCFSLGLPHSDNPPCVGAAVREAKIALNDSAWSSNEARTKGMRALAIAQLGSDQIDQGEFAQMLAEETIRQIVPIALRAAAELHTGAHKAALLAAAERCEKEGSYAARDAARAASYAASYAGSYAARDAARAASYAASYAARDAARAASYAARGDSVLIRFAKICTDILIKLGSPGSQWLDLL